MKMNVCFKKSKHLMKHTKKIKLMYRGIGVMLLVFMFFALIMSIYSDFMGFISAHYI
nr:DUF334 domain-containing protein [Staphylococcus pasteuri]